MRIVIFGAGTAGQHVAKELSNNSKYMIEAFLDNNISDSISDIKVYNPEDYLSSCCEDITIIIAAGAQKSFRYMLGVCERYNKKNVYKLYDIAGKNKLSILDENGELRSDRLHKVEFSETKPVLHYFEVPITDNCDLNCRGCLFASNATRSKSHVPIEQIKSDAQKMRELFSDVPWIRILGGEPLMHPDLQEVLTFYRDLFPNAELDLITNGMLIAKMNESFWNVVRDNGITIHVSGYEPTYSIMPQIDICLYNHGIDYSIMDRAEFWKFYTTVADKDPDNNYMKCPTCGCYEVYRGKISSCSATIAFEKLNEELGTEFLVEEDEDYLRLDASLQNGEHLKKWINRSHSICAYCNLDKIEKCEWKPSNGQISIEDYIV